MGRNHSPRFDDLEGRKLLASAHPSAVAHPGPALILDGSLDVNMSASNSSENEDGSFTTSVPVSGQLGNVGKVTGTWYNSVDANGNYLGPDMIQLRDAKGSFVVGFDNSNPGTPRPFSPGHKFYSQAQTISEGAGKFAHATEKGVINLITSTKNSSQVTLGLYTPNG